jgi:hypothetical protein
MTSREVRASAPAARPEPDVAVTYRSDFAFGSLATRRHSPATEEDVDAASDMSFPASDPPAWMGSMACIASGNDEEHPEVSLPPNASAARRAS